MNKLLSPEARALIEAARAAEGPSPSDKDRILAALLIRLPPLPPGLIPPANSPTPSIPSIESTIGSSGLTGATSPALTTAGKAMTTLMIGSAAKLKVLIAVVAATVGGTATWRVVSEVRQHNAQPVASVTQPLSSQKKAAVSSSETKDLANKTKLPSPPPSSRQLKATISSPPNRLEPSVSSALPSLRVAPPSPKAKPTAASAEAIPRSTMISGKTSTPQASVSIPSLSVATANTEELPSGSEPTPFLQPPLPLTCPLEKEIELLRQAQTALQQGHGQTALQFLNQHERQCSPATFREEQRAVRVLTLCQLGHIKDAQQEAIRLLAETPRSPQIGRLRTSCAAPALDVPTSTR